MRVNESGLYESIFYDLEKFGYKDVLEQYKDKTFQTYLLSKLSYVNVSEPEEEDFLIRNIDILEYLEKNGLDNMIVNIAKNTKLVYNSYKTGKITKLEFFNNINNYRRSDFHDKLFDVIGIHSGMFWSDSTLYIFKKNEKGDWNLIDKKIKY